MSSNVQQMKGHFAVLRAGGYSAPAHIFSPPGAALLTAGAATAPLVTAKFEVTFQGFSDEAKAAFQAAVDVWAITLTTNVPIRVDAQWNALDPRVLGQAGPANVLQNFQGAPQNNTWYPVALANTRSGSDLTAGSPHITAEFNSNFANWYFGTDGQTPVDKYDLMSVILHELGHGLGFVGSANVNNGQGSWGLGTGRPFIYDRFVENTQGKKILDTTLFPNPSTELAGQLQSTRLFFNGSRARTANGNKPVHLYAPITWEGGSSYSHLDEVTFPSGSSNSLMSPQLGMGEAIHSPGSIGLAILQDMGW